jgi:4-hydroxy-tetrahydrodipicolinate reductase
MIYPRAQYPKIAAKIDSLARRYKVAVIGTGANPGFFPDTLILVLTGVCLRVDKIRSARINDMGWGSTSVLKSLGVGFTPEEFERGVRDGTIAGHVGFHESIRMIADRIGWKIAEVQIDRKPIVSKTRRVADIGLEVNPGICAGCAETAKGISDGKSVIELELIQQIRPEAEGVEIGDFVWIEGEPSINEAIKPGIRGGVSTAAMLVNTIPKVLQAEPGLHNSARLPYPHYFTRLQSRERGDAT